MLGKNLMTLLREFEVCIPMLQRDYAQGRRSQEHVARKFLDAIFKALESGEVLHIDFVYGYRQDCKFVLIDGQQRLTTLWLLHLYLYRKAGKLDAQSQKLFERFSYATRPSSVEFCRGLAREEFLGEGAPSAVIMDRSELFGEMGELKNDPTIKSMMHMLDLIDLEARDKDTLVLVEGLDKITFDFFDMGQFKLGEELYIKMNARGKQLSDYENLKAFVEKDLDISEESTKEVLKRIDTRWSDYFYPKKEEKLSFDERGARFDDRGRNFLHYGAMFFHCKEGLIGEAEVLAMLEHQNIDEFYGVLQSVENLTWLDRTLELFILLAEGGKFKEMLVVERLEFLGRPSFFDDEKKSQNHGFGCLNYRETSYLFALMWYMRGHIVDEDDDASLRGIDIVSLRDFLKVSKHLIENHRLDKPHHLVSFFELFRFLSGCVEHDSVYDFMASVPYKSKFHTEIYGLEACKAELILRGRYDPDGKNNWEGVLDRTSNHPLLLGRIDHLLNFSSPSFKDHEPYKNKEYSSFDLERFQQYVRLSMQILDASFLKENLALLQRAWFSVGDYGLYSTNWFYGNCPSAVGFRDREAWNWLISGKSDEKEPYFKRLLDRLITYGAHGVSNEELCDIMQKVIDDTDMEGRGWWEQILIKQKGVFEFFDGYKQKIFQQACRIRLFDVIRPRGGGYFVWKAELLRGLRNTKDAVDLLGYGFYNYCLEEVGLDVGNLEVREFGGKKELRGLVFEIADDGMDYKVVVQCDGAESSIKIANNDPYPINLYEVEDIFEEFDAALESAGLA